jgi:hypothetical protein
MILLSYAQYSQIIWSIYIEITKMDTTSCPCCNYIVFWKWRCLENVIFILLQLVSLTLIIAGFIIRFAHEWLKPRLDSVLNKIESTVQKGYGNVVINLSLFRKIYIVCLSWFKLPQLTTKQNKHQRYIIVVHIPAVSINIIDSIPLWSYH